MRTWNPTSSWVWGFRGGSRGPSCFFQGGRFFGGNFPSEPKRNVLSPPPPRWVRSKLKIQSGGGSNSLCPMIILPSPPPPGKNLPKKNLFGLLAQNSWGGGWPKEPEAGTPRVGQSRFKQMEIPFLNVLSQTATDPSSGVAAAPASPSKSSRYIIRSSGALWRNDGLELPHLPWQGIGTESLSTSFQTCFLRFREKLFLCVVVFF